MRIISIVFIVVLLTGCCNAPSENPQSNQEQITQPEPIWRNLIIGEDSRFIYNNGLVDHPIHNNTIVVHTTLTKNHNVEDNRLCALDLDCGEMKWMFPADRSVDYDYYFNGRAYINGNLAVIRSYQQGQALERILCLNLDNGELMWEKTFDSQVGTFVCSDIVGIGVKAIYMLNNHISMPRHSIWSVDIHSGEHTLLYEFPTELSSAGDLMVDDDKLLFCTDAYPVISDQQIKVNTLNIATKDIEHSVAIPAGIKATDPFYDIVLKDDKFYYNCGNSIYCVSRDNGKVIWEDHIYENVTYAMSDIYLYEDKILHYGHRLFKAHNLKSGKKIFANGYQGQYGIDWVEYYDGILYMNIFGVNSLVTDAHTGVIKTVMICPDEPGSEEGFMSPGKVYNDKLYLMSGRGVYCYPTFPW